MEVILSSEADLVEAYPRLTREDIQAAIAYAADTGGSRGNGGRGAFQRAQPQAHEALTGAVPADESCDFTVVRALRAAGHDVVAIAEISPRATDEVVVEHAIRGGEDSADRG